MQPLSYAVELTQKLIRCPSVTPAEGGALDLLEATLTDLGFTCTRLPFGEGDERIDNLYARIGTEAPHFAFAGHTDVVPPGNTASWRHDAFSGTIEDGLIYGRGAADMKGGIAAFVGACRSYLATDKLAGSISLIITGDEEAAAINGTIKMVEWLEASGNVPDFCVVGEPTNPSAIGEVIKNGRRGSLTCALAVTGSQGHVAYPHLANNLKLLHCKIHSSYSDPYTAKSTMNCPHFQASCPYQLAYLYTANLPLYLMELCHLQVLYLPLRATPMATPLQATDEQFPLHRKQ